MENLRLILKQTVVSWFEEQCLSYLIVSKTRFLSRLKKQPLVSNQSKWMIKTGYDFLLADRAEIFDPVDFTTDTVFFSKKQRRSVSSEQATSLFVDQRSNYWITSSHGISIYREANQFYKLHEVHYNTGPIKKVSLQINALAQTDPSFLWIATNEGLFQYSLNTGDTQPVPLDIPNKNITTIKAIDGKMWLGMHDQLYCLDILSGKILKQVKLKPGIFFLRKGSVDICGLVLTEGDIA